MEVAGRKLTISPVFNIGFGYVKSDITVTDQYEFKSNIFLIPFFAFTYTTYFYLKDKL